MVDFSFQINSLDLSTIVSNVDQTVTWRNEPVRIPRRHGGRMAKTSRLSERRFNISGAIHETNAQSLQIKTDSLQALLFGLEGEPVKLRKLDNRHIWVQPTNLSLRATGERGDWASEEIEGELIAEDPRWINDSSFNVAQTNTQSIAFTLTNTGNALTPPTITITARSPTNMSQFSLINGTRDKSMFFTSVVSRTTAVEINCASLLAVNSGTINLGAFVGEFWELASGVNSITFSSSGPANVSITFNPRWY